MEAEGTEKTVLKYREDVAKLAKYIPWLESKKGNDVSSVYMADSVSGHGFSFPVFDSTLMSFIEEAKGSVLINENYAYTYTRNSIQDVSDEKLIIENAAIQNIKDVCDIFSRYILGGCTKARIWNEGVDKQIFLLALNKLRELIEFWDKPLS